MKGPARPGGSPARPTVARRREGVVWQPTADGGVVYHEGKGRICILNETATLVWKLCDGYHTVEEMVRAMAAQFAIDEVTARWDVTRCLDLLWRVEVVALETGGARH